jgi:hypothetical protein
MAARDFPLSRPSLSDRILLRLSAGKSIDGLRIRASEESEASLRRVLEALEIIKTFDRRRYDRILHDLELVWVRLLPAALACFDESLKACEIDTRFVLDEGSEPEIIAAAIVHEATHARLARCGIRYDENMRRRIEAVCVRRELAFAARLPNGEPIRVWSASRLQAPPETFTDAAFDQRTREGELEVLRLLGTPDWVVRTALTLAAGRIKLVLFLRKCVRASSRNPDREMQP